MSPLEYFWSDWKQLFDKMFATPSRPSASFDVSSDIQNVNASGLSGKNDGFCLYEARYFKVVRG